MKRRGFRTWSCSILRRPRQDNGRRNPRQRQHRSLLTGLTGHLVFTTLHANNVIDVIGRFLNMGVEAYNCLLAQLRARSEAASNFVSTMQADLSANGCGISGPGAGPISRPRLLSNSRLRDLLSYWIPGSSAIHELLDLSDNIREIIARRQDRNQASSGRRRADESPRICRSAGI
jgi:type IV pilus assembly protein PilB